MQDETLPRGESEGVKLERLYGMSGIEALDEMVLDEWAAAQEVLIRYNNYLQGDKGAVLEALYLCMREHLPIPVWCEKAYMTGFEKVRGYEVGSWDGAFGKPHPKGTHLGAKEEKRRTMGKVFRRVRELSASGHPVDNNMFEKVGRELGIGGKSKTGEYYYAFINSLSMGPKIEDFIKNKGENKNNED